MDTTGIRVTPYNLAAEQSVLGAMLLDKDCVGTVIKTVRPDDFYDPRNKELFEAVLDLFNLDKPFDVITLAEQMKLRGTYEKAGGDTYLIEVANAVPTTANVSYYAGIVADYSLRRRLIGASSEISELAYEGEETTDRIVDLSEQKIFDISQNRIRNDLVPIADILSANHALLSEQAANGGASTGIMTGFNALDDILGGLHKSNLVIVAARPAMGKSSFALNVAQYAALKENASVAVFTLEMSKEEVVNRVWFGEAGIESNKVRHGLLETQDWVNLGTALKTLSRAKIYIDDTAAVTVMDIRAKCRRLAAQKGLDLIVIDHMQLMESARRSDSRQQEISEISRSLKMLAKDLDIPVLVLAQLSRANESRTNKRPMLSDLRESGAIEQDADVVLMLYRDEYYNEATEHPGEAEVIITKHRSGETGTVYLQWQKEFARFANMPKVDKYHQE